VTIQGPKEYRWTTHMFYCTDCEAPRFASMEALDFYTKEYPDENSVEEIVQSFVFCLACAHGPEDWAKECANPEGEEVV